jgi:hypothetical protein
MIHINERVTSELSHGGMTGYVCSSVEDYNAGIFRTDRARIADLFISLSLSF